VQKFKKLKSKKPKKLKNGKKRGGGRPKLEISFGKSVVRYIVQQRFTDEEIREKLEQIFPKHRSTRNTAEIKSYRSRMNRGLLPHLNFTERLGFNEKYKAVPSEKDGREFNGYYKKKRGLLKRKKVKK